MIALGVVAAGLAYGVGSAVVPVLNAELYVGANAALLSRPHTWAMVVAVTLGTVVGKVVIFRAARAGRDVVRRRPAAPLVDPGRIRGFLRRISDMLLAWLADPWRGVATVLVSAFVGIPPLLAVAAVAGVSSMGVVRFALAVLVGRAGRFLVIAAAALGLT